MIRKNKSEGLFQWRKRVPALLALLTGISGGLAAALLIRQVSPSREASNVILLAILVILLISVVLISGNYMRVQRRSEVDLRKANRIAVRAEQAAVVARQQALGASNAKSEFLATMSHEIRTPLSGILGYADLLSEEPLTTEQARYVQRIQVAGHSLLTVVDDILDFSKVESGAVTLDAQPFSMSALVDNVVSIIAAGAEKKGLSVKAHVDSAVPAVVAGDVARLRQVLLNLLNNAVKFTRSGGIVLRIEYRGTGPTGERILFAVEDTGIGIPGEKQGSLFRRFSQVDSSIAREFGGSGLGLAISQQLVNLMGGRIEVESEPGLGSVFSFEIVLPQDELVAEVAEEEIGEDAAGGRILVVEDLEENRELARAMLQKAGFQVDCAINGLEAVGTVQSTTYALVLMDVQMPRMDGISATKAIRNLPPPACNVPIVAMTANVLPHQIAEFRAAGMNDHIGKPYTRSGLLAKVREWQAIDAPDEPDPVVGIELIQPSTQPTRREGELVFDSGAVDRVRELLGDAWVGKSARRLQSGIENTLQHAGPEQGDREELARGAHKLVSQASQLGFFELSRCCRDLEEDCWAGRDYESPLAGARSAAASITDELNALATEGPAADGRPPTSDHGEC